jgi:hypothetical protein
VDISDLNILGSGAWAFVDEASRVEPKFPTDVPAAVRPKQLADRAQRFTYIGHDLKSGCLKVVADVDPAKVLLHGMMRVDEGVGD